MPVSRAASRVAPAIAVTDADRKIFRFEHRALLDMQLEIGQQFAAGARGGADMIGIEAEFLQRLAHGDAGGIAHLQHAFVEGAGDRAAAEQRGGEAHALLVGKAGDLDRERQPLAAPVQIGDAGDRSDHAERPVPFAGVAHGVVMRAEHQAWQTRRGALIAAADIADRIEMRVHAGLAHPGQDQIGRGAMLAREEDPGKMFAASSEIAASALIRPTISSPSESFCSPAISHVHPAHALPLADRYKFGASDNLARSRQSMGIRRRRLCAPSVNAQLACIQFRNDCLIF